MSASRTGPGAPISSKHYTIPTEIFEGITDGSSWSFVISRLSDVLNLPDLSTRHGLKKVHARFDAICKILDAAYSTGHRENNEKIMGAVVGMMTKMCTDAILRNRLFEEEGILEKITPLLLSGSTRHLALRSLVMITHHSGAHARQEIAHRLGSTLVELIQNHPDDHTTIEFAIVTLSHATEAVMGTGCDDSSQVTHEEADIRSVLETMVTVLRKPSSCLTMITHTLDFFRNASFCCPTQCESVPGLLNYITAFTRSRDICVRAQALTALFGPPLAECQQGVMYVDTRRLKAIAAAGPPAHLQELLVKYGRSRSDLKVTVDAMSTYAEVIIPALHSGDMYKLGKRLGDLLERAEYVVGEGIWLTLDGHVCLPDDLRDDDPAKRLTTSMPMVVKTLRGKGGKDDLDAADVIEMKFLVICGKLQEASALAYAAIKRNPRLAYAYSVISMYTEDVRESIRAAKKGLKCPRITPFLRNQMLWHATSLAGTHGFAVLRAAGSSDAEARAEGAAFLASARADAETFLSEAPPDNCNMLGVLSWYALVTMIIRGPELSEDLRELGSVRRKIQTSMDFMDHIRQPSVARTLVVLTQELVFANYTPAAEEWGALVRRFDTFDSQRRNGHEHDDSQPSSSPAPDGDLAEWLGSMGIEGGGHSDHADHACGGNLAGADSAGRKVDIASDELHRCSWCGTPSAILKKCGGCGKTIYCDVGCQKSHWAEHKSACKSGNL